MQSKADHAMQVISLVSQQTDRAILFYSCGKDSITLLNLIAPHFKEIVCVFMYFVKDLDHINTYLKFSQAKYKNIRIIQLPHWNLTWLLRSGVYCVPNDKIKLLKLKDIIAYVKKTTGIDYVFLGMKQADSLNRRLMLRGYELEAINRKSNLIYPLSHWSNLDVEKYIQFNHLPKPIKYTNKKKSQGLTFDIDVFLWLKKNYPGDLEKIIRQFPLSESILFEHEQKQRSELTDRKSVV